VGRCDRIYCFINYGGSDLEDKEVVGIRSEYLQEETIKMSKTGISPIKSTPLNS
jgi:hypothetical protein